MMHIGIQAESTPDKPAYVMAATGLTVTYRELNEKSNQGAQLFRSLGLVPGDHIAMCMENNEHFLQICWAAQRAGLYYTCISSGLTAPEVAYIVDNCDAKVFIGSNEKLDLTTDLFECPNLVARYLVGSTTNDMECWEDATASQPATPIRDEIEGGLMLYSSGTTGRPKGIKRPLSMKPFGCDPGLAAVAEMYAFDENMIYLSPAPLYHGAPIGFSMTVLRRGGTVVVMEHFDAERALALIEEYKVTHSQWVPTMFVRMLKLPEAARARHDYSSLRYAVHAAAPCPVPVKEEMINWWGPIIYEYYGGTEGVGLCKIDSHEWLTHKGSVGKPVGSIVHILDEESEEDLPTGELGAIYFESRARFEYYKDPEKTKGAASKQGYTTLGDVGYVDKEGYLYLTDRKSFMIISGGVNIYPQETENCLITHPGVADVAVIGVPNEEFGEEVKAVVQPQIMADASPELAEELIEWCKQHISHIKCPRTVDFMEELPRHATGKLYKRLLKDQYWGNNDSRIV
jgi:acyl-CoA synthetase (AMP-forming)/AMP-acid ligase II|tara:strand:+ start:13211 stop:14752 length:1542 start_codon:yes stop_codon:yes gene_type:complete